LNLELEFSVGNTLCEEEEEEGGGGPRVQGIFVSFLCLLISFTLFYSIRWKRSWAFSMSRDSAITKSSGR
jgi:hypothetical protein